MRKLTLAVLVAGLLSGAIACQPKIVPHESSSPSSTGLPGEGVTVKPIHAGIAEEDFQTEVVNKALEKLGYEVEETREVEFNWM